MPASEEACCASDYQIQPSEYYAGKGHLYVNTPYGQGILLGMKDAFAQVKLRWGGLMSIRHNKINPHQTHIDASLDRPPSKEMVNDAKRSITSAGDDVVRGTKRRRDC